MESDISPNENEYTYKNLQDHNLIIFEKNSSFEDSVADSQKKQQFEDLIQPIGTLTERRCVKSKSGLQTGCTTSSAKYTRREEEPVFLSRSGILSAP